MSEDDLLSSEECAALLNIERHRWGLWVRKGIAPKPEPVVPGRQRRQWSKAAVLAWVSGRRR